MPSEESLKSLQSTLPGETESSSAGVMSLPPVTVPVTKNLYHDPASDSTRNRVVSSNCTANSPLVCDTRSLAQFVNNALGVVHKLEHIVDPRFCLGLLDNAAAVHLGWALLLLLQPASPPHHSVVSSATFYISSPATIQEGSPAIKSDLILCESKISFSF